ncbi:CGNR zinc finger domain-containing protein [Fodinicola acaciae]|uniref:CGNR zinc finger domain-containing protein n=1 Tax=Fodinicola acaciae TaxID=2681555 RepID=UPI0013D6AF0F|nr:ABATE domain-containing protein [Fodinicola acaciae]
MATDWVWDGGRPSVDLVNTYRDRKTGGRELLRTPADLAEWLALPEVSATRLRQAIELREAINDCVTAAIDGERLPAVDLINQWAARRRPVIVRLHPDGSAETEPPADPVAAALAEIAADAVDLLSGEERGGLRICGSADCGLRFVDRSQAGRRQWCSMARCGNREKARAHRARMRFA